MNEAVLAKVAARGHTMLNKASKKNEPLDAFLETPDGEAFHQMFSKAIQDQAAWLAKNIDKVPVPDIDSENIDNDKAILNKWLYDNMPRLPEVMSVNKVFLKLKAAFEYSVEAQLNRQGYATKAANANLVKFKLSNKYYIAVLKNHAEYLLRKAKLDDTTRNRMSKVISDARTVDNATVDELAELINKQFEEISIVRANMISVTEVNNAMSEAQMAFMKKNKVQTKSWIAAGPNPDDTCMNNQNQGPIPIDEPFESGDLRTPAHTLCHCYMDGGEVDLDAIDIWDGS